jgi:hypothetical protein
MQAKVQVLKQRFLHSRFSPTDRSWTDSYEPIATVLYFGRGWTDKADPVLH